MKKVLICLITVTNVFILGCQKEIAPSALDAIDELISDPITAGEIEYRSFYKGIDVTVLFDQLDFNAVDLKSHLLSLANTDAKQKQLWQEMYSLVQNKNILFLATVGSAKRSTIKFNTKKYKVDVLGLGYSLQQVMDFDADTIAVHKSESFLDIEDVDKEIYYYAFKPDIELAYNAQVATFQNYFKRIETGKTVMIQGLKCKEIIYEANPEFLELLNQPYALVAHKYVIYTSRVLPDILNQYLFFGLDNGVVVKADVYYNLNNTPSMTIEAVNIKKSNVNNDDLKINIKYPMQYISDFDTRFGTQYHQIIPMSMLELEFEISDYWGFNSIGPRQITMPLIP